MNNRRSLTRTTVAGLALIALHLLSLSTQSLGAPSVQARDAVVLIFSRGLQASGLGNGFTIGDGSLIVTAHHIVFSDSSAGGHLMLNPVTIVSPYLGEAVHGDVIAADEDLDLAVIKVPWKGHPSLELASDHEIIMAKRLQTIRLAYGEEIAVVAPNQSLHARDLFESDTIRVDIVGVRARVPRFVQLVQAGRLKRGWSGAPMILPDATKVAACFTNLSMKTAEGLNAKPPKPSQKSRARGPALSQLKRLLGAHGYASIKARTPIRSTEHAPDPNALQAFQAACKACVLHKPGSYAQALEPAQAFIELRPGSPMGYEHMAFALERMDRKDEAKLFYEQALERKPVSAALQLYYSQFLSKIGQADRAMEILEGLKHRGVLEDCVCIGMVNILGEQGRFEGCIELLNERLAGNPRNAYLWQQKAGCLAQTQGLGMKVAECFEKAVALRPEIGPLRGNLAQLLKQIGALERAEFHYRELLGIEPNNPVVYVWLATFLVDHRPTAKAEALKYAEKALRLPVNPRGPSQQKIQDLVSRLKSQ